MSKRHIINNVAVTVKVDKDGVIVAVKRGEKIVKNNDNFVKSKGFVVTGNPSE